MPKIPEEVFQKILSYRKVCRCGDLMPFYPRDITCPACRRKQYSKILWKYF